MPTVRPTGNGVPVRASGGVVGGTARGGRCAAGVCGCVGGVCAGGACVGGACVGGDAGGVVTSVDSCGAVGGEDTVAPDGRSVRTSAQP